MATARKPSGSGKTGKYPRPRTTAKPDTLRLLRNVRKPPAPPMRVEDDPLKYSRARERARLRRERDAGSDDQDRGNK